MRKGCVGGCVVTNEWGVGRGRWVGGGGEEVIGRK